MGPKMQGAILNGLFNLSSPVQFTCPTADCKWDDFSSLAVTSTCQNVTSSSKIICDSGAGETICNYTVPSGLMIRTRSWQSSGGGGYTYFNSTAMKPLSYDYGPRDSRRELVNSTLARMAMADVSTGWRSQKTPDIVECSMRLCARITRNMTVSNGTLYPGDFEDIELDGVPGRYEQSLSPQVNTLRDWYTFNITGDHPSYPGNRSFSYNYIDLEGAQSFLYDIFTSDKGSVYNLPLMDSTDRAATVAAISNSMSYAFAHAPSGEVVEGRALSSELYIKVHWLWIILPLTEVVMSVAFLLCTLIHTQRKGVTVWKSSGIVPLLTVMVGWSNSELGAASWREVEKRSKNMRGRLVTNDGNVQGLHRTE